jgi:hypothetical protein
MIGSYFHLSLYPLLEYFTGIAMISFFVYSQKKVLSNL